MLNFMRNTCPQLHTIISTSKNMIKSSIPTKQPGQAHFSEVNMIISDFRLTSVLVVFTTSRWSLARGHRVDTTFGPMEFETRCGDLVSILVIFTSKPSSEWQEKKWSYLAWFFISRSGYIFIQWLDFCCFPDIYNWVVVGFLTLLGTRVHHTGGFVQQSCFWSCLDPIPSMGRLYIYLHPASPKTKLCPLIVGNPLYLDHPKHHSLFGLKYCLRSSHWIRHGGW